MDISTYRKLWQLILTNINHRLMQIPWKIIAYIQYVDSVALMSQFVGLLKIQIMVRSLFLTLSLILMWKKGAKPESVLVLQPIAGESLWLWLLVLVTGDSRQVTQNTWHMTHDTLLLIFFFVLKEFVLINIFATICMRGDIQSVLNAGFCLLI